MYESSRPITFKEVSVYVKDAPEIFVPLNVKTKNCNAFGGDLAVRDISDNPKGSLRRYFLDFSLALHQMGCDVLEEAILIQSNVVSIRSAEIPKYNDGYRIRATFLVPEDGSLEVFTERPVTKVE